MPNSDASIRNSNAGDENGDTTKVVEAAVAARFLSAFQTKLDQLQRMERRPTGAASPFKLEDEERKILWQVNNFGLLEGSVAGIVTLITLRRARSAIMRRMLQQRNRMAQQQHSGVPPPSANHVRNSPFQQQQQQLPSSSSNFSSSSGNAAGNGPMSPIFNLFGWILDATVSFSIAATVSLMYTDQGQIMQKIANIPSVPGRSIVAEEFCPSALQTYQEIMLSSQKQQQQTGNHEEARQQQAVLGDPRSPYLKALVQFTKNCQRRAAYENQLRQDYGHRQHGPVDIPPPGVPENVPGGSLDDLLLLTTRHSNHQKYSGEDIGGGGEGDFYDPAVDEFGGEDDKINADWADSFVTDQQQDYADGGR